MSNSSVNAENQPLRCGIMVIGSLLWHEDSGGHRRCWQQSRLDLSAQQYVNIPLRYGRMSQSWRDAFTMILDAEAPNGQAVLVPCKTPICSFDELVEEVRWLWAAEAKKAISDSFHSTWGCIGTHFGSRAIAAGFEEKWRGHFQAAKPLLLPAIDSAGRLQVPWPRTLQDEPVEHFDIILATATMPKPEHDRPRRTTNRQRLDRSKRRARTLFFREFKTWHSYAPRS